MSPPPSGMQASGKAMRGAARSWRLALRKAFELVLVRYAFALVMVAAAFGLRKLVEPITGTGAPFVLFFAAVTVTAMLAGPGPGICAALASIPLGAFVFVLRAGYPLSFGPPRSSGDR